ncbi:terpenoid synthase [Thelephora terrestris]|uniref:(2E,6E)-farnesyl diphosphate synthase n=1 Tax=Thelephora terrestris TaxID=56493 RepID=A0A9P6HE16_9AGAM|nr:terpenoid synthase [Thelephora terrestris]
MTANYDDIITALTVASSSSWSETNETILLEPYTHITSTPGKEIRTQLTEAFNLWLNVPRDKLQKINRIVTMLHSSSLLIDDIQDDAQLRRGSPVAHKIYGVPQTINSANYVYFLAMNELFQLEAGSIEQHHTDHSLQQLVTDELLNLHRGQGLELYWRDSLVCPTEEEYISMVNNKTGGLFRIGIKLMMACGTTNTDTDYIPLVNLLGVYFQIRDDYMNLQSTEYAHNKGFAEDLTEGKFSFPVVHGVRANPSNRQILNVLQKRPTTPTLKKHVIGYLANSTHSFAYTLSVMDKFRDRVITELQRLGGNPRLDAIVELLSKGIPPSQ